MRSARPWLLVFALAWAAAAWVAHAQPAAVADALNYVREPEMNQVVLSPSGKRLAMLVNLKDGRRAAAVMDLDPAGPARVVASHGTADIKSVDWVNDDRLVVWAFEKGAWVYEHVGGLFAVDHDGNNLRELVTPAVDDPPQGQAVLDRRLPLGWWLYRTLDDGSADVLMYEARYSALGERTDSRLARLNTVTGRLTPLDLGMPGGTSHWMLDGKGQPLVAVQSRKGRHRLLHRKGSDSDWEVVQDVDALAASALWPMGLESDQQMIVASRGDGDTLAYFSYDLVQRRLNPDPLVRVARFDAGSLEFDSRTRLLLGVHLVTDRPQTLWFDERIAAIQKGVDAALPPGRFNRLICGRCESTLTFVVLSQSDRQPGEFYLYQHDTKKIIRVGSHRPWLDEKTQGTRSFHWVDARDGLKIPTVVTHPAGSSLSAALPAVVLVHGGPWQRGGDRRWSGEAQWLAQRGCRVIEPEFRGSSGFGVKHLTAGFKQWGQAMQDDLADAVAWAANQGLVDAQRVCIVGRSYGGYAALMGPVRNPGVYRCAASVAGVTDLALVFKSWYGDLSEEARRFTLPVLVGDPDKDAALLKAQSPIERVADIKVPVLLVQGAQDRRVPRIAVNRFEHAAKAAGVDLERVDYADEHHGIALPANQADFLRRLDRFLAQSLAR